MGISPGLAAFRLSFQLSPIIFTGGIASFLGGVLPIIAITEAADFLGGLLSGSSGIDIDDLESFFAHFEPLPGASIVDQQIGHYSFANQAVAANAVIRQPLQISMRMVCPARGPGGYALKLATMLALQTAFSLHNAQGGTYVIATPNFFYTDCVMLNMKDTSLGSSAQRQNTWQLDFEKPLLTLADAAQAENGLLKKITAGVPMNGLPTWTGIESTINSPSSLGAIGTIPAAQNPAGTATIAPAIGSDFGPG